jgi:drug/metabolite transporter (DMT)-like permease
MEKTRTQGVEIAVLFTGQLIASTAVLMIKINEFHPFALAAYRTLFAVLFLSPVFFLQLRKTGQRISWGLVRPAIVPGIFLAIHFLSWNIGARNTIAANASLIVNMIPIFLPLVVMVLFHERPKRFELVATMIAIVGLLVLGVPSFRGSRETLLGDLVSFGSMLFLAVYYALARRNQRGTSIWLYVTPLYLVAGLVALAAAVVVGAPLFQDFSRVNSLTLLGIVLGPTILGHSAVNHAMRSLPSQLVGLSQLSQSLWAGIMGFVFLGEVPDPLFAVAALAIVTGVVITVRGHARRNADNS